MIEYLKLPINFLVSFIICSLLKLNKIKSNVINCLEKGGYSIMLVKEVEKNFTEIKREVKGIAELKQEVKGIAELRQDNRELKEELKEIKDLLLKKK